MSNEDNFNACSLTATATRVCLCGAHAFSCVILKSKIVKVSVFNTFLLYFSVHTQTNTHQSLLLTCQSICLDQIWGPVHPTKPHRKRNWACVHKVLVIIQRNHYSTQHRTQQPGVVSRFSPSRNWGYIHNVLFPIIELVLLWHAVNKTLGFLRCTFFVKLSFLHALL